MSSLRVLQNHVKRLRACEKCPEVVGPVVSGGPVFSPVMLVGQAPGIKEGSFGKPFAWTAGKTLFKWFSELGFDEEKVREKIYFAAVCRCFPGKNPKGGDRVPSELEVANCRTWLERELEILQPSLLIPVGKLAISQFMEVDKLQTVIGKKFKQEIRGYSIEIVPLPHPSGASTWHRREPGISLLKKALTHLKRHSAIKNLH